MYVQKFGLRHYLIMVSLCCSVTVVKAEDDQCSSSDVQDLISQYSEENACNPGAYTSVGDIEEYISDQAASLPDKKRCVAYVKKFKDPAIKSVKLYAAMGLFSEEDVAEINQFFRNPGEICGELPNPNKGDGDKKPTGDKPGDKKPGDKKPEPTPSATPSASPTPSDGEGDDDNQNPPPDKTPSPTPTAAPSPGTSLTSLFVGEVANSCCVNGERKTEFGACVKPVMTAFLLANKDDPRLENFKKSFNSVYFNENFKCPK